MKIYFISICGTGVGNLAILLKNLGHDVKGSEHSEKVYYPPISDLLKKNKIPVTLSFDPNEITPDLDLVIMGGAALIHNPENPQVKKAKELGLRVISYARGVGEFLAKENNIEVVGNHGKTTTTALTAWCLKQCGIDISYFIGGAAIDFQETIHSGKDPWSVCEGDEHPSLGQEPGGKFLYHNPKHVIFTSADWDHKNIYTTELEYLDTFNQLFKQIPEEGLITACMTGKNVLEVLKSTKNNKINLYTIGDFRETSFEQKNRSFEEIEAAIKDKVKSYVDQNPTVFEKVEKIYFVDEIDYKWRLNASRFRVKVLNSKTGDVENLGYFETSQIGPIGIENSLATISCLHGLGFELSCIKNGISSFSGVHRKLEIVHNYDYVVINDHAHSPIKIESSLKAVRTKYSDSRIFVIFHVNQSGLKERKTFEQLRNVFNLADYVLIPRVTPEMNSSEPIYGKDYINLIKEGAQSARFLKASNVYYTPVITQMKSVLENNVSKNDVVLIMSSGDAREFIDVARSLKINK